MPFALAFDYINIDFIFVTKSYFTIKT